jgi:hypothetical protein
VIIGDVKDDFRLTAVDAATGRQHWSIEEFSPLLGGDGSILFRPVISDEPLLIAGPPEDFLVFVHYYHDYGDCTHPTGWCPRDDDEPSRAEQGVAALSGKDGSVRWMTPVITRDETRDMTMELFGADEDLLLVGSVDRDRNLDTLSTLALNTSDGQRRWQHPGVEAGLIAGGTVIGRIPSTSDDVTLEPSDMLHSGAVVAIDAISGDRRWDLSQRFAMSAPSSAAGDLVVVEAVQHGEELREPLAVEAATGREVARLGDFSIGCASDAHSLIACIESRGTDDSLVTFQLDERKVRVSRRTIPDPGEYRSVSIYGMWRGRVFVGDVAISDRPGFHLVVDRSANVLTERVPGQIVAISDSYAIFRTNDDDGAISVHAVKP